ncbi:hypothetical protein [Chromobacterium haemolyticum]|uniref:hypothetical protein n=1 Tax=Chromobacterium haemolyticum TaxID=394935 RepID=UPI003B515F60
MGDGVSYQGLLYRCRHAHRSNPAGRRAWLLRPGVWPELSLTDPPLRRRVD